MSKQRILFLTALSLATLAISCEKETGTGKTEPLDNLAFTAKIEADTKTSVDAEGKVTWVSGDKISVTDDEGTGIYKTTGSSANETFQYESGTKLQKTDATFYSFYPSSISGTTSATGTLPEVQNYADNGNSYPMYAKSESRDLYFQNLCGIMEFNLSDVNSKTLESIKVTADQGLRGTYTVSEADGAVLNSGQPTNVTLSCGNGVALSTTANSFRIAVPKGEYTGVTIELTSTDKSTVKFALTADKKIQVARSNRTPINIDVRSGEWKSDPDLIGGRFSISADKYAMFSKGNLYCHDNGASANPRYSFALENEQYQFHGRGGYYVCFKVPEISPTTFLWDNEVPGLLNGRDESYTGYFQWNKSHAEYGDNFGAAFVPQDDIAGQAGESLEWGKALGPNSQWSTLTKAEWNYLFSRTDPDLGLLLYRWGTVCGVKGVLLFPDGSIADIINRGLQDYYINTVYDSDRWDKANNELHLNLVFLPAAGWCHKDFFPNGHLLPDYNFDKYSVIYVTNHAGYWASDANNSNTANALLFDGTNADKQTYSVQEYNRFVAAAVRLVQKFNK